jgi:hypothetical protein
VLENWRVALSLSAVAALVYISTGSYAVQSFDTAAASEAAAILVRTGSVELTELSGTDNPWIVETERGVLTNRFPGVVFYSLPFYGAAEALGWSSRWGPGVLAASLVTAAAVGFMYLTLRALALDKGAALGASLFFAFGTATWAVSADAQWPHGLDQLLIAVGLRLMVANRSAGAGFVLGLLCFARPQLAPAILAIGVSWSLWDGGWRRLWAFGLPALAGSVVLIVYNGLVFGAWSPDNGYYEYAGAGQTGLLGFALGVMSTLFHPLRGILWLYPVLAICALGTRAAWRDAVAPVKSAAVGGGVALVIQLALNPVEGDTFFGSRLTIEPLTLAFPLLVLAWVARPVWVPPRLATGLLVFTVAVHAFGAYQFPYLQPAMSPGPAELAIAASLTALAAVLTLLVRRRMRDSDGSRLAAAAQH